MFNRPKWTGVFASSSSVSRTSKAGQHCVVNNPAVLHGGRRVEDQMDFIGLELSKWKLRRDGCISDEAGKRCPDEELPAEA